jgi:hypothetical protein
MIGINKKMSLFKKIGVSFPLVREVLFFVEKQRPEIDMLIKKLCDVCEFDEQTAKKVSLIFTLMPKADKWCSKDAELQAIVVGLLFYIYKESEEEIKEGLHYFLESMLNETQNDEMTEDSYKYLANILMQLNKVFETIGDVNVENTPRGEWSDDLLMLYYKV